MNIASKRITKLIFQLLGIQLFIFIIFTIISSYLLKIKKNKIAETVVLTSKNHLINENFRDIILTAKLIGKDDFVQIQFLDHTRIKHFKTPVKDPFIFPFLHITILKNIRHNIKNKQHLASFVFIYNRFEYLNYILLFSIISIIFSIPFVMSSKKKIAEDVKRDIELEKKKFFSTLANNLVHDIKQLTEPMKIDIEKNQSPETLVKSIEQIEKKILKILKFDPKIINTHKEYRVYSLKKVSEDIFYEVESAYKSYEDITFKFKNTSTKEALFKINLNEFKRALLNITSNSVDSTRNNQNNLIQLTFKNTEEDILITIQDNGRGIPQNILSNITKENFTFNKEKGTGKGLYQVKKFVENHSGKLNIQSQENKGTTLTLTFPLLTLPIKTLIHIDNEHLIRKSWIHFFSGIGIKVLSYKNTNEFKGKKVNLLTPIFIDSDLGDDQERGEVASKELSQAGFENIYLSTALIDESKINQSPWLKESIGKSPYEALQILFKIT